MTVHRSVRPWLLVTLLALTMPVAAQAQWPFARPTRPESPGGWTPAMVGIRFGYLARSTASVLGAQLRVPVLPSGIVELVPNADITFRPNLKDRQYALDVVYVTGGRRGGLMVGAGAVARNAIYEEAVGRETRKGWDLVFGLKTMPSNGFPLGIQIEERMVFIDVPNKPNVLSLGLNVPLWGWGHFGG